MPEPVELTAALAAPPEDVNDVHDLLERVWQGQSQVAGRDQICFHTALIELASNVLRHGDAGYGVRFQLTVRVQADRIEADLRDDGPAPDLNLENREMPDVEAESGRGLPTIQALVDELIYQRSADHNIWHIAKTLSPKRVP